METKPLFFVSYSRQTLYFTEALVLDLQKAGINLWFDLQQLKPGCNWREEIQEGLKDCDGIILVVSQAAIRSPYVALEWEGVLNSGKPIHLVVFEAVSFEPVTAQITNPNGSTSQREILPSQLLEKATSIIDARADFNGTVERLIQSLQGTNCPKDSIPSQNRLRIPTRMSFAVGFILLSMMMLTVAMAFTTVFNFLSYLPLLIWGTIATGWLGAQTLNFAQRDSYRETRYVLYGGIVYSLLFMKWLLPLVLIAIVIMHTAPDIRRRTPTGQAFRMYFGKQELVTRRYNRSYSRVDNLAIRVGKLPGIIKNLVAVFGIFAFFCNLAFVGLLLTGDVPPADRNSTLVTIAVSFVLMVVWLSFFLLRWRFGRLKREGYGTATKTGITYQAIYDAEHDAIMADDLVAALTRAGHQAPEAGKNADFAIVLLTEFFNNLAQADAAIQNNQKMIFVLGTGLTPEASKRFDKYTSHQWVDFRLQQPIRLQAMAEDLLPEESKQQISHSFGTHLEPSSFLRRLLPTRVNQYLLGQFVVLNVSLVNLLLRMINPPPFVGTSSIMNGLVVFDTIWVILTIIVGVWITNKAILREIGIRNIVVINLLLGFVPSILGFSVVMLTLPPSDSSPIMQFLSVNVIAIVVGYFIGVNVLKSVFVSWLNIGSRFPAFPDVRRDWDLWKRNLLSFAFVVLVTLSILAPDNNGSPQISSALRGAPGVVNGFVADVIDQLV